VLQLRNELITDVTNAFSGLVLFGNASALGVDIISGHYVRDGDFEVLI